MNQKKPTKRSGDETRDPENEWNKKSKAAPSFVDKTSGVVLNKRETETQKSNRLTREAAPSSTPQVRVSALPEIDLSALLDDPSISDPSSLPVGLISTIPSTYHHTPGTNQSLTAQDAYYMQTIPNFSQEDGSLQSFNTNDDILRAFQSLDLPRLAGILQGLDVPLSPLQSNTQFGDTLHGEPSSSFLDQVPINLGDTTNAVTAPRPSSAQPRRVLNTISKKWPTNTSTSIKPSNPNLTTIGPSIASPEHTHLLATKWLSAAKLKALVETEGLVYKKGKFSAIEELALKTAIENYRVHHGLSAEQLTEVIFSKSKDDDMFWPEITSSVPARPIIAVYHHVHRIYHPLKYKGKWSADEDSALIKAIRDHGQAWQKVSGAVGRMAQDCRDRWKNHVAHRSERQHGQWNKEEEKELTRIVTDLMKTQSKKSDNDIFWGIVSHRMGNKRSRQQCRIKWTDSLSKFLKNSGSTPRWSKHDSFVLVHKVASLDVRDDSEIDWNQLQDPQWNLWSAHSMQRRWRALKLGISGHETMAFRDIVEILQQKHPHQQSAGRATFPRSRIAPRKQSKSVELIEDDDDDDDRPLEDEKDDEMNDENQIDKQI